MADDKGRETVMSERRPWCPICRLKVATNGNYDLPHGFYETFKEHGCDGDGRRVRDSDYGFVHDDGVVVPKWSW
jgi:hypothetical protein